MNVVVVGSINADLLVTAARHPQPGETVIGRSLAVLPGGKGANQAVAAARLGAATALIGAVGRDGHAGAALQLVREAGVSLSGISTTAEPTGVALVTVADGGENTIVVVPGANATLDAAAVEGHADAIGGAAVVLLQGEIPRSGTEAAARLATGRVVLNLAPVIELEPVVFRRADPLVVNEHEAVLALKLLAPGVPQPASEETLAAGLLRAGVPAVVLTLGARGALCADASGIKAYPAPPVEAVDTTGAGDAFVGALGARLAAGDSLQAAAAFAVRVGAFAVQSEGAQPSFPTLADRLPG